MKPNLIDLIDQRPKAVIQEGERSLAFYPVVSRDNRAIPVFDISKTKGRAA